MTTLRFGSHTYELIPGETVLECLERHSEAVPSFCRAGVCQTCMLELRRGDVPAAAQVGLKDSWKERGCFLSCVCRPTQDLEVERCGILGTFGTRVHRVERLSADVLGVELTVPEGFGYRAGQFVQLVRSEDGLTRPYSLVSLPTDARLALHVRELPGGRMSGWLASSAGSELTICGPLGECYYRDAEADRPLVLAGTGTGLAPLLGVIRAAIASGHRGEMRLYHGSTSPAGLYAWRELRALAESVPNLTVIGNVLAAEAGELDVSRPRCAMQVKSIEAALLGDIARFSDHRVYLCGNPELVNRLRRAVYLAGGFLDRIHVDPFVPPGEPRIRLGPSS